MGMGKLNGNETIRDVVSSLAKPEPYVRGVLGNMSDFRRRGIDPIVKIGTTGQGIYPHYRIEPANGDGSDIGAEITAFLETMIAFGGRNHKPMEWTAFDVRGEHWSEESMTYDEVQTLLGSLRGYKGKRP